MSWGAKIFDYNDIVEWICEYRPDVEHANMAGDLAASISLDALRPDWGDDWDRYLQCRVPELIRQLLHEEPPSGIRSARERATLVVARRGHTTVVTAPSPLGRGSPRGSHPAHSTLLCEQWEVASLG